MAHDPLGSERWSPSAASELHKLLTPAAPAEPPRASAPPAPKAGLADPFASLGLDWKVPDPPAPKRRKMISAAAVVVTLLFTALASAGTYMATLIVERREQAIAEAATASLRAPPPPEVTTPVAPPAEVDERDGQTPDPPAARAGHNNKKKEKIRLLTRPEVIEAVRTLGPRVAPCLSEARKSNSLVPGTYTFVLDWTIRPDGKVKAPRLTGPTPALRGSLPGCFASVMARWTFPTSSRETPVKGFPLGPVVVR